MLKSKREPVVAPVLNEHKNYLVANLRRAIPTIPTRPVPKRASDAGSGIGGGVAEMFPENVVRPPTGFPPTIYCEVNRNWPGVGV